MENPLSEFDLESKVRKIISNFLSQIFTRSNEAAEELEELKKSETKHTRQIEHLYEITERNLGKIKKLETLERSFKEFSTHRDKKEAFFDEKLESLKDSMNYFTDAFEKVNSRCDSLSKAISAINEGETWRTKGLQSFKESINQEIATMNENHSKEMANILAKFDESQDRIKELTKDYRTHAMTVLPKIKKSIEKLKRKDNSILNFINEKANNAEIELLRSDRIKDFYTVERLSVRVKEIENNMDHYKDVVPFVIDGKITNVLYNVLDSHGVKKLIDFQEHFEDNNSLDAFQKNELIEQIEKQKEENLEILVEKEKTKKKKRHVRKSDTPNSPMPSSSDVSVKQETTEKPKQPIRRASLLHSHTLKSPFLTKIFKDNTEEQAPGTLEEQPKILLAPESAPQNLTPHFFDEEEELKDSVEEDEFKSETSSSNNSYTSKIDKLNDQLNLAQLEIETLKHSLDEYNTQSKLEVSSFQKYFQELIDQVKLTSSTRLDLIEDEFKSHLMNSVHNKTDQNSSFSSILGEIENISNAVMVARADIDRQNASNKKIFEVLKILQILLEQDEHDKSALQLTVYTENNTRKIVSLKPECISCTGSNPTVISAFKAACINYQPSPISYNSKVYSRFQIIQYIKPMVGGEKLSIFVDSDTPVNKSLSTRAKSAGRKLVFKRAHKFN